MRPRTFLFVVLAVLMLVPGWTGYERLALLGRPATVHATRMPLDPGDPARRRVGRLTFMGGVMLTSPDRAFGGFSALALDRGVFTLLSDGGNVVRLRLGSDGRVQGATFGDLAGGPNTGWRKEDRDSESLALDPRTGTAWVGLEHYNAIWRFGPGLTGVGQGVRPAAMRRWTRNGGPESLLRRRDGSFIAIQEEATHGSGTRDVVVWRGDPVAHPDAAYHLRYRPPPGYDPADATELPDGRLLILNRGWRFPLRFANVLEVVARAAIRPGAVVRGQHVATIDAPLTRDNFEGVAATTERGHTILWLVSDDNRVPAERTLLMKFRLD